MSSTPEKLFTLPAVPAGNYKLWIMAEGTDAKDLYAAEVALAFTATESVVPATTLQPSSTIKGSIKADADRLKKIRTTIPGTSFSTAPLADGSFQLVGLPKATFAVRVAEDLKEIITTSPLSTQVGTVSVGHESWYSPVVSIEVE